MRIGIDANPLRLPMTGVGRYLYSLLAEFPRDWSYILYSKDAPVLPPALQGADVTMRTHPGRTWALSLQTTVARQASQDGLDVFWAPNAVASIAADVPTVLTVHDLTVKLFRETMRRRRWLLETLMLNRSIAKAARVVTVSGTTAQSLRQFFPDARAKVVAIPIDGGTAVGAFARRESRAKFVLAVGTVEPRKNYTTLLEAVRQLWHEEIELPLVLVGHDGWRSKDFHARLDSLLRTYPDAVDWRRQASDAQLAELYSSCRLFVIPSLYEGFGMPLVEAMRAGTPVVAADIDVFREVGGDAPVFVAAGDAAGMASAMNCLAADNVEWDARSVAGRGRASTFSWRATASRTVMELETVA